MSFCFLVGTHIEGYDFRDNEEVDWTAKGKYSAVNGSITFSDVSSTKMYCANSQEDDFKVVFDQAQKFRFTSKGELIFDLKMDSGTIIFK